MERIWFPPSSEQGHQRAFAMLGGHNEGSSDRADRSRASSNIPLGLVSRCARERSRRHTRRARPARLGGERGRSSGHAVRVIDSHGRVAAIFRSAKCTIGRLGFFSEAVDKGYRLRADVIPFSGFHHYKLARGHYDPQVRDPSQPVWGPLRKRLRAAVPSARRRRDQLQRPRQADGRRLQPDVLAGRLRCGRP